MRESFVYFSVAPSFISDAFATMGLIAGISGHPISSAGQLIGQPTEKRKEVLFERPEYKKADDYISIQVKKWFQASSMDEFLYLEFITLCLVITTRTQDGLLFRRQV